MGYTLVPDDELQDVVDEINNHPRKILGYTTARETLARLWLNELRVAIDF